MTQYVFDSARRHPLPLPDAHERPDHGPAEDAARAEAFFVILEPGEAPPIHTHHDAEQVFFVLEGRA